MYFWVVPATFLLCTVLFLGSFHLTGALVDKSCSRVSLFHHFAAMLLGMYAHWQYRDRVMEEASFGQNTDFPAAVVLQHFNIGYFLYDTIHVTVWDQRWFLHHSIALAGYGTSEIANVFALANAVNTWITESGSLLYQLYLLVKTDFAYVIFVVVYTATRIAFAWWSFTVFRHCQRELSSDGDKHYPVWAPYDAALLQVLLLVVNLLFLSTHLKKLCKLALGKPKQAKKSEGEKGE